MKNQTRGVGVCIGVVLIVWMAAVWSHKADATEWNVGSTSPMPNGDVIHYVMITNFNQDALSIGCFKGVDAPMALMGKLRLGDISLEPNRSHRINISQHYGLYFNGDWLADDTGRFLDKDFYIGHDRKIFNRTLRAIINDFVGAGQIKVSVHHDNGVKEVLRFNGASLNHVRAAFEHTCDPSNQSHLGDDVVKVPMQEMPSVPAVGGDTPLHTAIRNRDIDGVRTIVSVSDKPTLCRLNHLGQTPYALASILDFLDASLVLIAADATTGDCR